MMNYREPELKANLAKFEVLLKKSRDDAESAMKFKYFLKSFLRLRPKMVSLPTTEVMTVIKQEKPVVYHRLKKSSSEDQVLSFLTSIEMDYDKAQQNLDSLKQTIH